MHRRLPTEKEATENVELLEKETGIKYSKNQKEKAVKKLMGKETWFE